VRYLGQASLYLSRLQRDKTSQWLEKKDSQKSSPVRFGEKTLRYLTYKLGTLSPDSSLFLKTSSMSVSTSQFPESLHKSLADQSKEKILFAAMELFARNGYHKTTAATIAKTIGISHGLLFYHFGSKEGLLQSIVDYSVKKIEDILVISASEPALQLIELGNNFKKSLQEDRDFWKLYHSLIFQPDLKKEIVLQLTGVFDDYRKELVRIFEKLGYLSPSDTMQQFETMRHGIMVCYLTQGEDFPVYKLFRNLIDRFS